MFVLFTILDIMESKKRHKRIFERIRRIKENGDMIKYWVTFTQSYEYGVDAKNEDEALYKAKERFEADMRRPIARTYFDDYEIEEIEEEL